MLLLSTLHHALTPTGHTLNDALQLRYAVLPIPQMWLADPSSEAEMLLNSLPLRRGATEEE